MPTYIDILERLRARPGPPLLVEGPPDPEIAAALRGDRPEALFGEGRPLRADMAACVVAGLHLWNDDFDAAHTLCQGIATPTGSYWHGLCHRREGHRGRGLEENLANARYWFRRVGEHPAFAEVYPAAIRALEAAGPGMRWATEAASLLRARGSWDPFAFIDWVGQAEAGILSPPSRKLLEEIQRREMELLIDWCARQARET